MAPTSALGLLRLNALRLPGAFPFDLGASVISLGTHARYTVPRMTRIGTRVMNELGVGGIDEWTARSTAVPSATGNVPTFCSFGEP